MNEIAMIKTLQPFMQKSQIYKEIFKSQSEQLHAREDEIKDILNQVFLDTATWGLEIYERALLIPVDRNKPLSERRERIKAKLRGQGKVGVDLIKSTIGSWVGGTVDVLFEDSTIKITFVDLIGIPQNINDVMIAMEEIKPAHLAVMYTYKYNTWASVANKTWGELEQYTWGQVLSSNIF